MFNRAAPKVFLSQLSSEELDALFVAYAACTNSIASSSSSSFALKAVQHAKNRRKKAQKAIASEGIARVDILPQEDRDVEAKQPQWLTFNHSTGQVVCQAQSSWDTTSVTQDSHHEMDARSGAAGIGSWPGYFGYEAEDAVPTTLPSRRMEAEDALPTTLRARGTEVKPIQWLVSNRCNKCGSEESYSWSCIEGIFYCERCWGAQFHGQRQSWLSEDACCRDLLVISEG